MKYQAGNVYNFSLSGHDGEMKKFPLLTCAFLLCSQALAAGDLGVGLMVGYPTGFTAKKTLSNGHTFDAGAGWSLGGNTNFQIHSDWLFNKENALYWDESPLDLYAGIGARMKFADDIEFGLRAPVGVSFYTSERQLEVFTEVAPILDILPDRDWELHLLAGIRYYL